MPSMLLNSRTLPWLSRLGILLLAVLGLTVGLATAGALPEPAQDVAGDVLGERFSAIGITVERATPKHVQIVGTLAAVDLETGARRSVDGVVRKACAVNAAVPAREAAAAKAAATAAFAGLDERAAQHALERKDLDREAVLVEQAQQRVLAASTDSHTGPGGGGSGADPDDLRRIDEFHEREDALAKRVTAREAQRMQVNLTLVAQLDAIARAGAADKAACDDVLQWVPDPVSTGR
jgi:hypothetical protein